MHTLKMRLPVELQVQFISKADVEHNWAHLRCTVQSENETEVFISGAEDERHGYIKLNAVRTESQY